MTWQASQIFIPYLAGLLGMYWWNPQQPLNGTSCSSTQIGPGWIEGGQLVVPTHRSCRFVIKPHNWAYKIECMVGHGDWDDGPSGVFLQAAGWLAAWPVNTGRISSPLYACRSVASMSLQSVTERLPCRFVISWRSWMISSVMKTSQCWYGRCCAVPFGSWDHSVGWHVV